MATDSSSTAEDLKNQGNALFKAGHVAEASKFYARAEATCPTNPIYPSNLSAALYEEGDYLACSTTIDRCWKLLGASDANPGLALRLDGSVSQKNLLDMASTIDDLKKLSLGEPVLQQLWYDWDSIADETGDREGNRADALRRFSALPIFRKTPKPILEYYNIGQDQIMSLFDDWGEDYEVPLALGHMADHELSKLSILLGGVGDARHLYGTLVGLHRAYKTLDQNRRSALRVHITLLDLHPAALTRDICMLLLLEQLMNTPAEDAAVRAEILSTMFYTFVGVVMPSYCHDSNSPPWLHVAAKDVADFVSAIDFWTSVPARFTVEGALQVHTPTSPAGILEISRLPGLSPEYRAAAEANVASKREEVLRVLGTFDRTTLDQLRLTPLGPNATAKQRQQFAARREELIQSMLEEELNDSGNMSFERMWYEQVKIFVPPRALWSRHVGMDFVSLMSAAPSGKIAEVKAHVNETWKPNSTLFDRAQQGYPDLKFDPFQAPKFIDMFNERFDINSTTYEDRPDAPAFTNFSDLFENVVAALAALKGQIKLEILCGELTQELRKMRFGGDDTRPSDFPRLYTRGYLSNVPDYTHGPLNTVMYAVPVVKEVASSSFLNSGIWKDDEEFIHTYTLTRFLGCRFINKDAVQGLTIIGPLELPLPITMLAPRTELVAWLTRTLLYSILPSSCGPNAKFRARLPNNLVSFVALLVHLRSVGYPAHWLGDYLQTILSGALATDIAPYAQNWPIPVTDLNRRVASRTIRLDPWVPELEAILATVKEGVPFGLSLQTNHTDVGTFEATVEYASHFMGFMMGTMANPMPVEDPVVCLLLYRPGGRSADEMVAALPSLLEGGRVPAQGTVCVLTAQERVVVPVIRWRLGKAHVQRMREERWVMVAYRTDVKLSFTAPVSADQWREVVAY
ncbi:hypothetical protein C8J57DRAFT_1335538 [Mycena rebaudengoi]|nr:hypothetical protein C8J57DRAFT_1335538 [Mycena rebaudengoi]